MHLFLPPVHLFLPKKLGRNKCIWGRNKCGVYLFLPKCPGRNKCGTYFFPEAREEISVRRTLIYSLVGLFFPQCTYFFPCTYFVPPCTYLFPRHALLANARSKLRLPAPSHALLASARSEVRLTAPITPSAPPHGSSRIAR